MVLSRDERRAFLTLHVLAFVVHTVDTVLGSLVLHGSKSGRVSLANQFPVFNQGVTGDDANCPTVRGAGGGAYTITYKDECAGTWDGLLALVVAEGTTAAFHLFYILELLITSQYGKSVSVFQSWSSDGYHSVRWVEYAISATIISLSNLTGIGIRNAPAFIIAACALACVQLCGLIAEAARAFADKELAHRNNYQKGSILYTVKLARLVKWISLLVGCILQGAVFACIFMQLSMSDYEYEKDGVPSKFTGFQQQSAVYFGHYCVFPVVAMLYAFGGIENFIVAEWCYVSAGVASKAAIFWLIFGTVRDLTENWTKEQEPVGVNWPAVRVSAMIVPILFLISSISLFIFGVRSKKVAVL
jgi:hypothetical protein